MAKKRIRNIKLEQNELMPTTIGIFESKKKSPIGIVLILTIFVLFIVFLPEISDKVDAYLHPKPVTPIVKPKPNPVPTPNPGEEEDPDELASFNSDLKIDKDEISVNGFRLDSTNNTLTYSVTNKLKEAIKFEDLNYYLELYNSDQTLMERVKITGDTAIMSGMSLTFTKKISANTASNLGLVGLVSKTTNDYNSITLNTNEDGSAALVCTCDHEKVTYKFINEELKEVTSEVSYTTTDPDYASTYENNKVLSDSYKTKTGVTSSWFEYSEGYNVTTNVNLNEASRLYIYNADSFKAGVEPKVVKFEMEAQGFSCK